MNLTSSDLVHKYEMLIRERRNWEPGWQEIADHLIPRKNSITVQQTPGQKKQSKRYVSTGMHAHEILAANLQGTLTSRAFRWFDLRLGDSDEDRVLGTIPEVRQWLQSCSKRLWVDFNSSNFQSQTHELYLDITAFGTGAILHEELEGRERFNGFNFTTYPIEAYVFEENERGIVDQFCGLLTYTGQQAIDKFGEEEMPEKVLKAAQNQTSDRFNFLHWIVPRHMRDEKKKDAGNMPFASIYISLEGNKTVKEGGYQEFPVYVARWNKNSNERYGRGPGDVALPDLKVLDKATELDLDAWAKYIDPPWFTEDDGVIGAVDLRPGKGTVVRDRNAMWFYEFRGNPNAGRLQLNELRQSIRQTFFADQLELPQSDRMTAEEIRTRVELMQRVLGPTLGRIESEFLNPLIERSFRIMFDKGAFPEPPAEMGGVGPGTIEVHYSGPLARSERMSEISALDRWVNSMAGLANVDPTVFDIVDTDEIARRYGESLDVPEQAMRNPEDLRRLREGRAQERQQQQQAELGLNQSQIAQNMAKAQSLQ
tara:strand:+ start:17158 stop:18774 length:1617 start_codon:yes stop_codon:yes gene_type:complete